ncbi:MAG: nucleotide exchange factor GrpE, partial [Endomicrobiia bacterium]
VESMEKQTVEGIKLIYNDFESFLKKEGIVKIDSLGKTFNPLQHEILEFEDNDELEDNTIVDVLIEGYKLKTGDEEIILRPAKVKVSKKKSQNKETQNDVDASNIEN